MHLKLQTSGVSHVLLTETSQSDLCDLSDLCDERRGRVESTPSISGDSGFKSTVCRGKYKDSASK
jgi:hypothetical protein